MTIRPTNTTGFVFALALLIMIPSIAAACGYSTASCGYLTSAEYQRTDDGSILLAVEGGFAWGSPWSGLDGVAGTKEATLLLKCELEDEWCQENLRDIFDSVGTHTPVYAYEFYNAIPQGLQEGMRELFVHDAWNMPTLQESQEDSFLCRAAAKVVRNMEGKEDCELAGEERIFLTVNAAGNPNFEAGHTVGLKERKAFLEDGLRRSDVNQLELLLELEMAFGDERLSLLEAELAIPTEPGPDDINADSNAEIQGAGCSTAASPRSTALWAGLLVGMMLVGRRTFATQATKPCA
jgi:hypothetical protein